jgi:hypothetical protein
VPDLIKRKSQLREIAKETLKKNRRLNIRISESGHCRQIRERQAEKPESRHKHHLPESGHSISGYLGYIEAASVSLDFVPYLIARTISPAIYRLAQTGKQRFGGMSDGL